MQVATALPLILVYIIRTVFVFWYFFICLNHTACRCGGLVKIAGSGLLLWGRYCRWRQKRDLRWNRMKLELGMEIVLIGWMMMVMLLLRDHPWRRVRGQG